MSKKEFEKQTKWQNFALFNFLAKDQENALDVMTASQGFAVPGIVSSDYASAEAAVQVVRDIKKITPLVSVGLGNQGDWRQFNQVMQIAKLEEKLHINQPIETAAFVQEASLAAYTNALVRPSGTIGKVTLSSGGTISVEEVVAYCQKMNIPSIKFMSLEGTTYLDECVYLAKVAAKAGIYGIEPAGGIKVDNIAEITQAIRESGIPFFMPHIFGATIHPQTGRIIPQEIEKIMKKLEEIA